MSLCLSFHPLMAICPGLEADQKTCKKESDVLLKVLAYQYKNLSWIGYIYVLLLLSHLVVSDSVLPHRRQPTRLPHPWDSPGQNTGVGSHSLLRGFSPTQGSNPGLLHCRQILYSLNH